MPLTLRPPSRVPLATSDGLATPAWTAYFQDTSTKILTAADIIAMLLSPPSIGATTPAAGKFTTLSITALPTSAAGLPVGSVWNNGGVLCVV